MRTSRRHCPQSFHGYLAAALLICIWFVARPTFPQGKGRETIDFQRQRMERIRNEVRAAHPEWTDFQRQEVLGRVQKEFNGEATVARDLRLHSLADGLRIDLRRAHPDWTYSEVVA